ncbi:MAG: hypothetical protein Tsb002_10140 [Wenzhouxiangellaceae bacterium]
MDDETAAALGKRLILVRGANSQAEFAIRMGVHKNTLARYESGERVPDTHFLNRLAAEGVNVHWLITGMGNRYAKLTPLQELEVQDLADTTYDARAALAQDFVRLTPVFDSTSSLHNNWHGAMVFSRAWLEHELGIAVEDLCLARMQGNSMEPTIQRGSLMVVDCSHGNQVASDGLYLMSISRKTQARRVQHLPGGTLRIICSHPDYPDIELASSDLGDDPQIIGRVVWVGEVLE